MFKFLEALKRSPSYVASGQRVLLRQLGRQDLRTVKRWFEDMELVSFAFGIQGDTATLRRLADSYYKDVYWWQRNIFAIDALDGTCIGFTRHSIREDYQKHAKVGIVIGEAPYRSGGYGTEAMRLLLDHLFLREGVERVDLDTAAFNLRAQRSFAKCGFRSLGSFTEINYVDGRAMDKIWMSITCHEHVPWSGTTGGEELPPGASALDGGAATAGLESPTFSSDASS